MFEKPSFSMPLEHHEQSELKYVQDFSRLSVDQKREKQIALKHELYLAKDNDVLREIQSAFSEIRRQQGVDVTDDGLDRSGYKQVSTSLIVRAPTMKDWSDSYHALRDNSATQRGENAVIEIATRISQQAVQSQNIGDLDSWLKEEVYKEGGIGVEVNSILGPRGPLYLVHNGSHRVATAKLLHLPSIWVNAREPRDSQQALARWYDAMALLGERARKELQSTYDRVYPAASKAQIEDENLQFQQSIARLPEIHAEAERYHVERNNRIDVESRRQQELRTKYNVARAIYDRGVKKRKEMHRLLNIVALERLKKNATLALWNEYRQEIDDHGCLIRKDGEASSLQAANHDDGDSPLTNIIDAVDRYKQLYPEEFID